MAERAADLPGLQTKNFGGFLEKLMQINYNFLL